jgi:hypothetical protein
LVAAILAGPGCTRTEPVMAPPPPHGGTLAGLPDGQGKLEIVRQEVPGAPDQARLILYFLDAHDKPLSPAPTAATLALKVPRGKSISFKPAGDADPSKAGSLESPPFATGGDISGELSATIGGKPVKVSIAVR